MKNAKMTKGQIALNEKFGNNEVNIASAKLTSSLSKFKNNLQQAFKFEDIETQVLLSFDASFKKSVGTLQGGLPYMKISMLQVMNNFSDLEGIALETSASAYQQYIADVIGLKDYSGKEQLTTIETILETGTMQEEIKEEETFEVADDKIEAAADVKADVKEDTTKDSKSKGNASNLSPRSKNHILLNSPEGDIYLAEGGDGLKALCKRLGDKAKHSGVYFQMTGNKKDHNGYVAIRITDANVLSNADVEYEIIDEASQTVKITKGDPKPYMKTEEQLAAEKKAKEAKKATKLAAKEATEKETSTKS